MNSKNDSTPSTRVSRPLYSQVLASMGDKLVTCPYDICHKVKETRLKIHISKAHAKEKYLNKNLYECFYNPRHVVPLSQRLEHLMGCKDNVDRFKFELVDPDPSKTIYENEILTYMRTPKSEMRA
ncbi:hypothetical protein JTE90_012254 [Oedothorax gibbosus]|uniref:CHHC U11-48K-type domain-containing protein n=2 Tax=Oedothorax gibbosus TaxID=931172 RepID=A0AAV6TKR5_9ARAC|nr:hypothetical protein JTE90_012254 [Oedothorax gibbosus]